MKSNRWFQLPIVCYSEGILFCAAAFALWSGFPHLHDRPFMLFLTAVILTTRFAGFGPGIFSILVSLVALDVVVLPPHFRLSLNTNSLVQLGVFLAVSLLVSSIGRQRSRADLRVERVQRQLADIVESSQDAILSNDVNGVITSWNGGAERLYGYRADEIIGQEVSVLAAPEQPDDFARIMSTLKRGERVQHYIAERVDKGGKRLTLFVSISALLGEKGEIVGASAISQDVTAQVRAEEALRKNEKLATAGRLAATIAHEINNPLEAVGNLLYLARNDKGKADGYLAMAERELARVAKIAQQALGFVREPTSAVRLDVGTVLSEVLELHDQTLAGKHIGIQKEFSPETEILGFPGELRQVFANLIVNAIDASPNGGRLRVRVQPSHDWSNGQTRGVRVSIADTGYGMSHETLTHLFEPFYTTKKDRGTGLGLWLSYNIVQKHGGAVRVRSRTQSARSGTVFNIFLPRQQEDSQAA